MKQFKVVHIKDGIGNAVRCDRQTQWGNPFPMKDKSEAERQRVIAEYRQWLWHEIQFKDGAKRLLDPLINRDEPITYLACWCAPKACHCEVLARACIWRMSQR